jgi:importin subunit beta-1
MDAKKHRVASLSHSWVFVLHRDLCTAFGKDVLKLVEARPMIHELLTEGRRSKTNKAKTLATWATKELRKLKNQAW